MLCHDNTSIVKTAKKECAGSKQQHTMVYAVKFCDYIFSVFLVAENWF